MTTDSKHTPGPWHTGVRTAYNGRDIYGPLGDLIAVADTFRANEEEAKANAQLIARAPDLLAEVEWLRAALEASQSWVRGIAGVHHQEFADKLRAALKGGV